MNVRRHSIGEQAPESVLLAPAEAAAAEDEYAGADLTQLYFNGISRDVLR